MCTFLGPYIDELGDVYLKDPHPHPTCELDTMMDVKNGFHQKSDQDQKIKNHDGC